MSARNSPRKSVPKAASKVVPAGNDSQTKTAPREPRITPRNSIAAEALAEAAKETPYETLKQLANIPLPRPSTPLRRASSAGPPSIRRSARNTPGNLIRTPAGIQRPASARRPNEPTPHARAAIRQIELRRAAALTPGKDRRRSGLQQRETPRDLLRQLSKVLAPGTEPIEPLPAIPGPSDGKIVLVTDDLDDGVDLPRPRLSIPLGDEDDDSSLLDPPRLSIGLIDDENLTQRSIELPRRAVSEQPGGRFSRGSFGSVRTSDRFGDLSEIGLEALASEGFDPSLLQGNFDDYDLGPLEEPSILGDFTEDQQQMVLDDGIRRVSATSRTSDVGQQPTADEDTETTFQFTIPPRDSLAGRSSEGGANQERIEVYASRREFIAEEEEESDEATEVNEMEYEVLEKMGTGMDVSTQQESGIGMENVAKVRKKGPRTKRGVKFSKHGIQYNSLPAAVVKKLATTFLKTGGNKNTKISKDTFEAILQASDWFFEQVSDDLGTYANHSGRKTIDESDVVTLMKRQRQINATTTPFALAQRHLPRELLQDLRMAPPSKFNRVRQLEKVDEDEYVDDEDED